MSVGGRFSGWVEDSQGYTNIQEGRTGGYGKLSSDIRAVLPLISKIFEAIIATRIVNFFEGEK